jgi:glucoamylase
MDEVSYPAILAWQLGKTDKDTFEKHIKPEADFIVSHGPATPQERWELRRERGVVDPVMSEMAAM